DKVGPPGDDGGLLQCADRGDDRGKKNEKRNERRKRSHHEAEGEDKRNPQRGPEHDRAQGGRPSWPRTEGASLFHGSASTGSPHHDLLFPVCCPCVIR